MDNIMITFQVAKLINEDISVPVFVTIQELMSMLSEAFNIDIKPENRIQAEPLGRILNNNFTLDQEGVSHGALLTLI
jgi:uncharacterized ubiquitin-like protein YukD